MDLNLNSKIMIHRSDTKRDKCFYKNGTISYSAFHDSYDLWLLSMIRK